MGRHGESVLSVGTTHAKALRWGVRVRALGSPQVSSRTVARLEGEGLRGGPERLWTVGLGVSGRDLGFYFGGMGNRQRT